MLDDELEIADLESLDENPELALELYKLAFRVGERLKHNLSMILANYEAIRGRLGVRRFNEPTPGILSILAVDSTWSTPHLELVMGNVAVIASGYVIAAPQGLGSYGLSFVALRFSSGDDDRFTLSLELSARVKEYATALRKLEEDAVDIVMVDGPLYHSMIREFYTPLKSGSVLEESRKYSGSKLASLVSRALIELLDKAGSLDVPVVGVVKRVSSRLLIPKLEGLGGVVDVVRRYNDKLVTSLVLEPGEYIVIENYLEEFRRYLELHSYKTAYKRLLGMVRYCMEAPEDSLERRLCEYMERTAVAFYRHRGSSIAPQATRLDVYPRESVDRVVAYCMENTTENNVPAPIDYVDRYVRVDSQTIRRLYQLLKRHSRGREVGVALNIANAQKRYLYEWVKESF